MKVFIDQALFEPHAYAATERLGALKPFEYAQTRNHVQGAVSMLSPYLTHGVLSVPEVAEHMYRVHRMGAQHKFIFELAWREYFQHVEQSLGEAIQHNLHEGVLPDEAYSRQMPQDIRSGATGVPVIDQAVRQLYFNGYVHNHARLWLASYLVHIRKVHWRVGADWMYSHLLDGDIASNYLSWQWVAGTASSKPYLFNAANVTVHAHEPWHSPHTVIDQDMDTIDMIARSRATFTQASQAFASVQEPDVLSAPPPEAGLLPAGLAADKLTDREVWWIHPWSLSDKAPPAMSADAMRVAACWHEWTQQRPWSQMRWLFVAKGMHHLASHCWVEDAARLTEIFSKAKAVHVWDHQSLPDWPGVNWVRHSPPRLWPAQEVHCKSFSSWWSKVNRYRLTLPQLLRRAV
jgi:deoxyribodipyrimidine photo-lyase